MVEVEEFIFKEDYIGTSRSKPIKYIINENGCHVCTSHYKKTFGDIGIARNGVRWILSRYVWTSVNGEIPNGLLIRHKCDNPSCINTEHLELGTNQDNSDDKLSRGRQSKGSLHGLSKLTEEIVRDIKMNTTNSISELSKMYNISLEVVRRIDKGILWKHVVVDEKYNIRPNKLNVKKRRFSDNDIIFIRESSLSNKELATMFNVTSQSIREIKNYKNYKY